MGNIKTLSNTIELETRNNITISGRRLNNGQIFVKTAEIKKLLEVKEVILGKYGFFLTA
jgi:hypothetical protein|tara:strand:- start:471 stop:647 length:177 start_codon:yes stop_codon:yes gene_type:complete